MKKYTLTKSLSLFVILAITISLLSSGKMIDGLSLDRHASLYSLSWRWLTAHFTHFNLQHLLLNLSGLAIIYYINEKLFCSWRGLFCAITLCLWTSACVWFLSPEISRYAGLSGILHGLAVIAIAITPHYSKSIKVIMLLFWAGKTLREHTPLYDSSFMGNFLQTGVAVDAHLYGFIGGIFLLLILALFKTRKG